MIKKIFNKKLNRKCCLDQRWKTFLFVNKQTGGGRKEGRLRRLWIRKGHKQGKDQEIEGRSQKAAGDG